MELFTIFEVEPGALETEHRPARPSITTLGVEIGAVHNCRVEPGALGTEYHPSRPSITTLGVEIEAVHKF